MDVFAPTPPAWTESARHATAFCCPHCHSSPHIAQAIWMNRRSPVYDHDQRRKWQEFYHCTCGHSWWAWSSDRPAPPDQASVD